VREILALAAAGAAGTLGRWALSGLVYRGLGTRFPWGTLVVNVAGCFLLGALMELALTSELVPRAWRVALSVGFLGAFTTFSTFGYETMRYVEDGAWAAALANVGASNALGLVATWAGFVAARAALGGTP
jgi:CrcB protein